MTHANPNPLTTDPTKPIEASPSETEQAVESPDALTNPTVLSYFVSFNQADYAATANLFAVEGQLIPPFESAIVGREAIASYLAAEAKGMKAIPQTSTEERLPSGEIGIEVIGRVQTPLFGVRVSWQFVLNADFEIRSVKIKLLAALRDLLHLQR